MINKLVDKIKKTNAPIVVGLDPMLSYVPEHITKKAFDELGETPAGAAEAIWQYNKAIVDATYDLIPAVKPQIAMYEQFGVEGLKAFQKTVDYCHEKDLVVIGDVKRGDIGSTSAAYATGHLGRVQIGSKSYSTFDEDFATVNPYLGTDGIKVAGVEWKNPVTVASGTFGSGAEYSEFVDLNRLGAVTTKGVANKPWEGNPTPRVAEVYGGMLNAVGLQNPGIELFLKRDIPFLKQFDTRIVVNVCGHSLDEYLDVVKRLADEPIDMMEINISCPNVKEGGIAFGTDPKGVETITSEIKKYAKQPVIMKLSPNVTSIAEIARAAEAGGADAVSLINTITGMKIDINRRSFVLANKTGGMSGPAVHPVAVRMVYETAHAVNIPIIGMGGITNAADAIEMILAGATAVSVGTANFVNPKTTEQIVDGIAEYMDRYGVKDISELVGAVDR